MNRQIFNMLNEIDGPATRNMPATVLYNEGWMLRLVLKWFSDNRPKNTFLEFMDGSTWFSEALLRSKFLAKPNGVNKGLAEGCTHADGVVGDFIIGANANKSDLTFKKGQQFVVIEAKMFSLYSKGTVNAGSYDQVARNLVCMCNTLGLQKINLEQVANLGFLTFLPEEQIVKEKTFIEYTNKSHVRDVVKNRISTFPNGSREDLLEWFEMSFNPFLDKVGIHLISWEEIIRHIGMCDEGYGDELFHFYEKCLTHNRKLRAVKKSVHKEIREG